jgi:hypothetical protein
MPAKIPYRVAPPVMAVLAIGLLAVADMALPPPMRRSGKHPGPKLTIAPPERNGNAKSVPTPAKVQTVRTL